MARYFIYLYIKSFSLLVIIEKIVIDMPRKTRYTIGSDIRNIFREFIVSIARLNSLDNKNRLKYMDKLFDLLNQVYILLSVMKELKLFLKSNQYKNIVEELFII